MEHNKVKKLRVYCRRCEKNCIFLPSFLPSSIIRNLFSPRLLLLVCTILACLDNESRFLFKNCLSIHVKRWSQCRCNGDWIRTIRFQFDPRIFVPIGYCFKCCCNCRIRRGEFELFFPLFFFFFGSVKSSRANINIYKKVRVSCETLFATIFITLLSNPEILTHCFRVN